MILKNFYFHLFLWFLILFLFNVANELCKFRFDIYYLSAWCVSTSVSKQRKEIFHSIFNVFQTTLFLVLNFFFKLCKCFWVSTLFKQTQVHLLNVVYFFTKKSQKKLTEISFQIIFLIFLNFPNFIYLLFNFSHENHTCSTLTQYFH